MKKRKSNFLFVIALLAIVALIVDRCYFHKANNDNYVVTTKNTNNTPVTNTEKIRKLTDEQLVITYIKDHRQLPQYYITKKEAMRNGWIPSEENLCDVLPGRAIGGDKFSNREKKLPMTHNRVWYEADVNYNCGERNTDRVLFSNDGLIFLTKDHYKTFQQQ